MFAQNGINRVLRVCRTIIQPPTVKVGVENTGFGFFGQFEFGQIVDLPGDIQRFIVNRRIGSQGSCRIPLHIIGTVFQALTCPFTQIRRFGSSAAVVEALTVKVDGGFGSKVTHKFDRKTGVVQSPCHAEITAGTGGVRVGTDYIIIVAAKCHINGVGSGTGVAVEYLERHSRQLLAAALGIGLTVGCKTVVPPAPESDAFKGIIGSGYAVIVVQTIFAETVLGFEHFFKFIQKCRIFDVPRAAVNVSDIVAGFVNTVYKAGHLGFAGISFEVSSNAVDGTHTSFHRHGVGQIHPVVIGIYFQPRFGPGIFGGSGVAFCHKRKFHPAGSKFVDFQNGVACQKYIRHTGGNGSGFCPFFEQHPLVGSNTFQSVFGFDRRQLIDQIILIAPQVVDAGNFFAAQKIFELSFFPLGYIVDFFDLAAADDLFFLKVHPGKVIYFGQIAHIAVPLADLFVGKAFADKVYCHGIRRYGIIAQRFPRNDHRNFPALGVFPGSGLPFAIPFADFVWIAGLCLDPFNFGFGAHGVGHKLFDDIFFGTVKEKLHAIVFPDIAVMLGNAAFQQFHFRLVANIPYIEIVFVVGKFHRSPGLLDIAGLVVEKAISLGKSSPLRGSLAVIGCLFLQFDCIRSIFQRHPGNVPRRTGFAVKAENILYRRSFRHNGIAQNFGFPTGSRYKGCFFRPGGTIAAIKFVVIQS